MSSSPVADEAEPARRPRVDAALVVSWALVAAGAVLRIAQYASHRSLWGDESYLALNVIGRSFGELVAPLGHNQAAPLAFLWLERLAVLALGTGEYALRLVPLLAGLVSLWLMQSVARRLLAPWPAALAVGLFAASDRAIYYASEVKQYSTDVATALALMLATLYLHEKEITRARAAWYAALGALAVWFSHPAIFVLAGSGLALAALAARARDWRRLRALVAVGAAWVACFGLSYVVSLAGVIDNRKHQRFWDRAFLPTGNPLGALAWLRDSFLKIFENPVGFSPAWFALVLFLAGAVILLVARRDRFVLLFGPLLLCLVASALRAYPFSNRLVLFLVPVFVVGAVVPVDWILERSNARWWGVGAVAGLALALAFDPAVLAAKRLADPRTKEELRPVVSHLRERWRPGDTVYLYYGAKYPFEYYGPRFGFRPEDVVAGNISRKDPSRFLAELDALAGAARVWVVFSHVTHKRGVDEQAFFLEHLDRLGARREEFARHGATLYLYDLSPGAARTYAQVDRDARAGATADDESEDDTDDADSSE